MTYEPIETRGAAETISPEEKSIIVALEESSAPALPEELAVRTFLLPEDTRRVIEVLQQKGYVVIKSIKGFKADMVALSSTGHKCALEFKKFV